MKIFILSILALIITTIIVLAKTEDSTSVAKPYVLYGTYNGTLVPMKITSDGSLAIQ